ncbi:MAG: Fur family transcriptional regulator [Pseudomonadota bacterium]
MGQRGQAMQAKVFEVVAQSDSPVSAYDILAKLRAPGANVAPPTIYRALAALQKQKRVHRLESLSAYVAAKGDALADASIMSICEDCGIVSENTSPELVSGLQNLLGQDGFEPQRHVIEVHGRCAACGPGGAGQ